MKTLPEIIEEKMEPILNALFPDDETGIEHVDMSYDEFVLTIRAAIRDVALQTIEATRVDKMNERNMARLDDHIAATTVGEVELWNAAVTLQATKAEEFIKGKTQI